MCVDVKRKCALVYADGKVCAGYVSEALDYHSVLMEAGLDACQPALPSRRAPVRLRGRSVPSEPVAHPFEA